MNEIRNELLLLRNLVKAKDNKDDKDFNLEIEWILERFEYDIKGQLKELEDKQKDLKSNLETLAYVRKELGIKESE